MRIRSTTAFAGCCLLSFSPAICAPAPPETMTRIVARLSGPNIKPGSNAALPKTIYEAAPHYARIEDPPDSRQKMQKLTIFAEPDAYSVNLIEKTGTHSKDASGGSSGNLHLPIVLPFDPQHRLGKLDGIEFGSEYDFLTQAGATKEAGPIINNQPTDALRLSLPSGSALLVLRGGGDIPVKLSWQTSDGTYTYEYIEYADVPFDPKLFRKPEGIRFRELSTDSGNTPPGSV